MNYLNVFKSFIRNVFRDRTSTLEEYIIARNPQNTAHVEQLEREYHAFHQRKSMV